MRTNNTDNNSIQPNGVIFSTVSEESDTSPGLSIIRGGRAIDHSLWLKLESSASGLQEERGDSL